MSVSGWAKVEFNSINVLKLYVTFVLLFQRKYIMHYLHANWCKFKYAWSRKAWKCDAVFGQQPRAQFPIRARDVPQKKVSMQLGKWQLCRLVELVCLRAKSACFIDLLAHGCQTGKFTVSTLCYSVLCCREESGKNVSHWLLSYNFVSLSVRFLLYSAHMHIGSEYNGQMVIIMGKW